MFSITVSGQEAALYHLAGLADGVARLDGVTATIGSPLDYAEAVHEGARAHEILPRFKKALYWPGAGFPVRGVRHPGNQPNRFFDRALEDSRDDFMQRLEDGLAQATIDRVDARQGFRAGVDEVLKAAQTEVPEQSGALRDSLHREML